MPLEASFDNLDDLNPDWPLGTDPLAEGDDHIRGVKKAVTANILGSDTVTRLLSNAIATLLAGHDLATQSQLIAGILNDTLALLGSVAGEGDTPLATFDPAGEFVLFRAGLPMLTGNANDLVVNGEDETGVSFTVESAAGVEYVRLSGAPASSQLIDALVEAQNLTFRGVATGGATRNLFTGDPDGAATLYNAGLVRLQTFADGYTNGVVSWTVGFGSPEGVVAAGPGSIYSDGTSGSAKPLWMKNFSAGNTGWLAVDFQP